MEITTIFGGAQPRPHSIEFAARYTGTRADKPDYLYSAQQRQHVYMQEIVYFKR